MLKKIITLYVLLLMSFFGNSQLDTMHYIPPLHMNGNNSSSPQYVYLSTPEITPFTVTIRDGSGVVLASPTISNTAPFQYFVGSTIDPSTKLLVKTDSLGKVLKSSGLILSGENNFYCNLRLLQGSNQAGSLTTKGMSAVGNEFRVGVMPHVSGRSNRNFVTSIMATEDNTSIMVTDYDSGIVFKGTPSFSSDSLNFILNKGESYILVGNINTITANFSGFVGAKIRSDHGIVVNNGNMLGTLDVNSGTQDICIDQSVPIDNLGNEYVLMRGNGTNSMERPLIIGTKDNTDIFINGSLTPITSINDGEYYLVDESNYGGALHENMFIRTSNNVYMYQPLGGDTNTATAGLNFIPPISCFLPFEVNFIPEIDMIGTKGFNSVVTLFTQSGSNILVNGVAPPSSAGPQIIMGNSDWVTYKIEGLSGNINLTSSGPMAAGMFGFNNFAGYAGYFSGFGTIPRVSAINGSCAPGIVLGTNDGFHSWQWQYDGADIPGQTNPLLFADEPGNYRMIVSNGVGCVDTSNYFFVPACYTEIGTAKEIASVIESSTNVFDVTYKITLENLGLDPLFNAQVTDTLIAPICSVVSLLSSPMIIGSGLSPGIPNASFDPGIDNRLLLGTDTLGAGESDTIQYTLRFDMTNGDCEGVFTNQVFFSGNELGVNNGDGAFYTSDVSVTGSNPDENNDGLADEQDTTTICLPLLSGTTFAYTDTFYTHMSTNELPMINGWTNGSFGVSMGTGLTIDATSGEIDFSSSTAGNFEVFYAFGTNFCLDTIFYTLFIDQDTDGDGVLDSDELLTGSNPNDNCSFNLLDVTTIPSTIWNLADCDGDGVINEQELLDGTNPLEECSYSVSSITLSVTSTGDCDGDGVPNDIENNDGTNPLDECSYLTSSISLMVTSLVDCDGDGVPNNIEAINGTDGQNPCSFDMVNQTLPTSVNWNNSDCDGDGVTNEQEVVDGTNPLNECSYLQGSIVGIVISTLDCDGDGVSNDIEFIDGTDALDACSFMITSQNSAPTMLWNNDDCDGDGVTNGQEILDGTNPLSNCSYVTTSITMTVTSTNDCDGDGVPDNIESVVGTDGQDPCSFILSNQTLVPDSLWNMLDCDGDGVMNGQETLDGTNPLDDCSYLTMSITLVVISTSDCDGDGISNEIEALDGTDGQDPCSFNFTSQSLNVSSTWNMLDCDGDGVTNESEILDGTDPLNECSYIASSISLIVLSTSDCDGDGVPNNIEFAVGTDGQNPCSFNGVNQILPTSVTWNNSDCDGDGVTNVDEINGPDGAVGGGDDTDPTNPCSYNQSQVTLLATDIEDCDGDGVSNADEINGPDGAVDGGDATDANDPCDYNQVQITTVITSNIDCDGDGVLDVDEIANGTDPNDPCSFNIVDVTVLATSTGDCDGDGVTDADEVNGPDGAVGGGDETNPFDACNYNQSQVTLLATDTGDCDGDGVINADEINGPDGAVGGDDGTDSNDPCDYDQSQISVTVTANSDCDGDGVTDVDEIANGTDPRDPCSLNIADVTVLATNIVDCDGDGITNADEINGPDGAVGGGDETDPNDPCSLNLSQVTILATDTGDCDGDGVTNADEINGPDGAVGGGDDTDPTNPCEYNQGQVTILATDAGDCDGDGVTNADEINGPDGTVGGGNVTDANDPCDFNVEQVTVLATDTGDCDGDGVTNADEINGPDGTVGGGDGTDANDPCDYNVSQQTVTPGIDWDMADCDGDGVMNGDEILGDSDPLDECDPNPCGLVIPQAFTPENGDGVNDLFVIEGISNYPGNNVKIFNRWGSKVYEVDDYENDWNGTSNVEVGNLGGQLPTGTYYYIIDTKDETVGNNGQFQGFIYLKR